MEVLFLQELANEAALILARFWMAATIPPDFSATRKGKESVSHSRVAASGATKTK